MPTRATVSSLRGMVAAAHPLAATAGARVLSDGGNAFDAVVATAVALNVVEPFMSGLAGLGMATCYVANERRVRTLDFVPGVPASFDPGRCTRGDIAWGPRSSAVPGSLAGWSKLASELGSRPLAELLAPAIELAEGGFPAGRLYFEITGDELGEARGVDDEWRRVYTDEGRPPGAGFVLRQPDLARTLEAIASQGPEYLYNGPLGRRMVEHLSRAGGCLSEADLKAVQPEWLEPLVAPYRGFAFHTLPPPAESFQYLLSLRILDGLDLGGLPRNCVEHIDSVVRAIRLAGETRVTHNRCSADKAAELLGDDEVERLRSLSASLEFVDGRPEQWGGNVPEADIARREHTTSFSAADIYGNMVCVTQSLGMAFGAGVVIPGTGVCMNNFLNWGDLEPESPNYLAPGSRLAMCLAPSIATREDGEPVLAIGTPGSYGILQTQPQVIVQHVDFGLELQDAIDAPRVRAWDGRRLDIEGRIEATVVEALRERGHETRVLGAFTRKVGGFHAVARDPDTGILTGAADPRRDGYAAPV